MMDMRTARVSRATKETNITIEVGLDGAGTVDAQTGVTLGEELPEIRCEAGAAWVLAEETGREETVRTAYNVPREGEEPIAHGLVLLDSEGLGHLEDLFIGGNG